MGRAAASTNESPAGFKHICQEVHISPLVTEILMNGHIAVTRVGTLFLSHAHICTTLHFVPPPSDRI